MEVFLLFQNKYQKTLEICEENINLTSFFKNVVLDHI